MPRRRRRPNPRPAPPTPLLLGPDPRCEQCGGSFELKRGGICEACGQRLCATHLYGRLAPVAWLARLSRHFRWSWRPRVCVRCRRGVTSASPVTG
jgi:hypothetical protein